MKNKLIVYLSIAFITFTLLTIFSICQIENMTLHDAVFITVMLFGAGEPLNLDVHDMSLVTGFFMVGQTLLGLATLTVCFALLANFLLSEKIAKLMRREKIHMKDHVIVCGVGNVGFRVVKELERLQQKVAIIDRGDEKDYLRLAEKAGHKVILDNLKDEGILDIANIQEAKSIIICTGNDLVNMEVALNARSKRDDIMIVMRMFDAELARKVVSAFDIKVALSSSELAAPVFAAASLDRTVFQTIKVENELFVSARIDVCPNGKLSGMKVAQLLTKDLTILKLISGEERIKFPVGERAIGAHDRLYITCSLATLEEIKILNDEKKG